MNEEGAQLRNESIQHLAMLAGSPEASLLRYEGEGGRNSELRYDHESQSARKPSPGATAGLRESNTLKAERRLYVFDRGHLDEDAELIAQTLAISDDQLLTEPPLEPQDPLSSHVALSYHNLEALRALVQSIQFQRASLELAISNLNRVMTGTTSSLDIFREGADSHFESWDKLVEGWEAFMDAISKVSVIGSLIGRTPPSSSSKEVSATGKEKERFLGDYVSRDKMLAVRGGCAKVLADLKYRTNALQKTLDTVLAGAELVHSDFASTTKDLEDLAACEKDADEGHSRIQSIVTTMGELHTHEDDNNLAIGAFEELNIIDAEARDRISFLVERKNAMTRYLVVTMQRISHLQSDIASMPTSLGELDHDLRTKTDNFKYLSRLGGLIPAYVATVVEVVRRREYAAHLSTCASSMTKKFSSLGSAEKTRRKAYRMFYSGKLPWDVRGLNAKTDEAIPSLESDILHLESDLPDLNRDSITSLKQYFGELIAGEGESIGTDHPLRQSCDLLERLSKDLEAIDAETVRIIRKSDDDAEISFEPDHTVVERLEKQIRSLEESKEILERQLQAERGTREEELAQLNQRNGELSAALAEKTKSLGNSEKQSVLDRSKWSRLQLELDKVRTTSTERLDEVVRKSKATEDDLLQARTRLQEMDRQLKISRVGAEDLRHELHNIENQRAALRSDHGEVERELVRSRAQCEELEHQLRSAEMKERELSSAVADRDRLVRNGQAELELDRAVLEKEIATLRASACRKDGEISSTNTRIKSLSVTAEGLRHEARRWEEEATSRKADLDNAQAELEQEKALKEKEVVSLQRTLGTTSTVARNALKFAKHIREDNEKIIAILTSPPPTRINETEKDGSADLTEAVKLSNAKPANPPLDFERDALEKLLADVQGYDSEALTQAVKLKVETLTSVTKKWSREAKTYRERAHRAVTAASDKIAFRNFVKGDLALFLPTRNSAVPVWAAFNVSSPHHFLAATGVVSEQMKTREWIVARVTSVTEQVVDAKDPSTNPYLLAAGTKYFLLEVESWSSKERPGVRSRAIKSSSANEKGIVSNDSAMGKVNATGTVDEQTDIRQQSDQGELTAYPNDANAMVATISKERKIGDESSVALEVAPTTLTSSAVPIVDGSVASQEAQTARSGLANALASAPSSPTVAVASSRSMTTAAANDPFAGTVASNDAPVMSVVDEEDEEPIVVSPPATDFEPTITAAGAAPAFLPSSSTNRRGGTSASESSASGSVTTPVVAAAASSRQMTKPSNGNRVLSSSSSQRSPFTNKALIQGDVSTSLMSTAAVAPVAKDIPGRSQPLTVQPSSGGLNQPVFRSVSSESSSSILSVSAVQSSQHRRSGSTSFYSTYTGSPPSRLPSIKASATQEMVGGVGSHPRWITLAEDLAIASKSQISLSSKQAPTIFGFDESAAISFSKEGRSPPPVRRGGGGGGEGGGETSTKVDRRTNAGVSISLSPQSQTSSSHAKLRTTTMSTSSSATTESPSNISGLSSSSIFLNALTGRRYSSTSPSGGGGGGGGGTTKVAKSSGFNHNPITNQVAEVPLSTNATRSTVTGDAGGGGGSLPSPIALNGTETGSEAALQIMGKLKKSS